MIGAPDYEKFKFKEIINYTSTGLDKKDLSHYLAGLWEGDGHISNLNTNSPNIAITFSKKNLPLLKFLLYKYKGRIRVKEKENALVWILQEKSVLINFIKLINGQLRTPKINKFNLLIDKLNKEYIKESINHIKLYKVDLSELSLNGWLAGFFDADGSFKIRYTEKNVKDFPLRKNRIEVRLSLEQRKYDPLTDQPYQPIMLKIAEFLTLDSKNLKTSKHNESKDYWLIEVTSLYKLNILINYLKKYPLLTIKRNDFSDWLKVYDMMIKKEHLFSEEGRILIKSIKSKINKNRVEYNWDHLE